MTSPMEVSVSDAAVQDQVWENEFGQRAAAP